MSTPAGELERRRALWHDIRNSLGAMLSATEVLETRYAPSGREARLFQVLIEEIGRLEKLLEAEFGGATKTG